MGVRIFLFVGPTQYCLITHQWVETHTLGNADLKTNLNKMKVAFV